MSGAEIDAFAALQQYSNPYQPWDSRISAALQSSVAGGIVGRYIATYEHDLSSNSGGLTELLASILVDDQIDYLHIEPALGRLEWVAQSGCDESLAAGATLALLLTGARKSIDWRVRFRQPTHLRWGRWRLPCIREMAVKGDRSSAKIEYLDSNLVNGALEIFAAEDHATGCQMFHKIGAGNSVILLPRSEGPQHAWKDHDELKRLSVKTVGPVMARSMEKAFALLSDYSSTYRQWVDRAIAEIVISRHKLGTSQSGSWREAPGAVQMSWSPDPLPVAEALVHEASHQYAYQVFRVGSLDDGSDRAHYYSPPTRRNRPLDRILFAYHAFANILLFYREILKAGYPDKARVTGRIKQCLDVLSELDVPLRNSGALTPFGQSLYRPLAVNVASSAYVG